MTYLICHPATSSVGAEIGHRAVPGAWRPGHLTPDTFVVFSSALAIDGFPMSGPGSDHGAEPDQQDAGERHNGTRHVVRRDDRSEEQAEYSAYSGWPVA